MVQSNSFTWHYFNRGMKPCDVCIYSSTYYISFSFISSHEHSLEKEKRQQFTKGHRVFKIIFILLCRMNFHWSDLWNQVYKAFNRNNVATTLRISQISDVILTIIVHENSNKYPVQTEIKRDNEFQFLWKPQICKHLF